MWFNSNQESCITMHRGVGRMSQLLREHWAMPLLAIGKIGKQGLPFCESIKGQRKKIGHAIKQSKLISILASYRPAQFCELKNCPISFDLQWANLQLSQSFCEVSEWVEVALRSPSQRYICTRIYCSLMKWSSRRIVSTPSLIQIFHFTEYIYRLLIVSRYCTSAGRLIEIHGEFWQTQFPDIQLWFSFQSFDKFLIKDPVFQQLAFMQRAIIISNKTVL